MTPPFPVLLPLLALGQLASLAAAFVLFSTGPWGVVLALLLPPAWAALAVLSWRLRHRLGEERRKNDALAGLNAELGRSNDELERFAGLVSHDLKEPLRNISSYVQLLQRRYQGRLDEDADSFIGHAVAGVRRMETLIGELLALSRIGGGQRGTASIQAGAAVSIALAHLKVPISEAQAVIEVAHLPVVAADPQQLISLFQNLIGNAVKYRRDDARPLIRVGCTEQDEEWEFFVADNGIGIPPDQLSRVFDLFVRLGTGKAAGTGLGLAMCRKVVERHGGRIWAENAPGQGSTFRFTLPKAPLECDDIR